MQDTWPLMKKVTLDTEGCKPLIAILLRRGKGEDTTQKKEISTADMTELSMTDHGSTVKAVGEGPRRDIHIRQL